MERRAALLVAASVAGVILLGATAITANVRILRRSADDGIGELSVAVPLDTIETTAVNHLDGSAGPIGTDAGANQIYLVEEAGTVTVTSDGSTLGVASVEAADGWTWLVEESDDRSAVVRFASAGGAYVFSAVLGDDGAVVAQVDQSSNQTPAPTVDDDGSDDDGDDDHVRYEGWDDDD